MTSRTKLWALSAGALALSLALAGCGSSGGSSTAGVDTDRTPPPVMMDPDTTDPDTTDPDTTDPGTTEPAAPTIGSLFATAQASRTDAADAGKAAADAGKAATENSGKLTTMTVAGDSATAMANAQAILQAQTDAGQAVMDAQQALDNANDAKAEAEALDADHENRAILIAALDEAIKEAEAQVKAATAVRDGTALKMAVDAVTGGEDEDPQGTPRSIANAVGMDISMALLPNTTGGGTQVTHDDEAPAGEIADELKFETHDHIGMTWAMIVGDADIVEKRVVDGEVTKKSTRCRLPA